MENDAKKNKNNFAIKYCLGVLLFISIYVNVLAYQSNELLNKENEKLMILGGSMGATNLDASAVLQVAKMPSKEELLATITSMLVAPASNLAGALSGPASDIVGIVSTVEEKAA